VFRWWQVSGAQSAGWFMADNEEENNNEEAAKPKSKLMLIIIIAVVVILAGGGGAAYFLLSGSDEGGDASVETEEPVQKPAIYFDLKPAFVVNYQWKGRQRYVQISISVMTRDENVVETLQAHMPLVRNNLVMILGAQDFEVLRTPEGKEAVRESVLEEVQRILTEEMGEPGIEKVLFTNFVMQ